MSRYIYWEFIEHLVCPKDTISAFLPSRALWLLEMGAMKVESLETTLAPEQLCASRQEKWARKMVQWVKAWATKPEDLGQHPDLFPSLPHTHQNSMPGHPTARTHNKTNKNVRERGQGGRSKMCNVTNVAASGGKPRRLATFSRGCLFAYGPLHSVSKASPS